MLLVHKSPPRNSLCYYVFGCGWSSNKEMLILQRFSKFLTIAPKSLRTEQSLGAAQPPESKPALSRARPSTPPMAWLWGSSLDMGGLGLRDRSHKDWKDYRDSAGTGGSEGSWVRRSLSQLVLEWFVLQQKLTFRNRATLDDSVGQKTLKKIFLIMTKVILKTMLTKWK